MDAVPLTGQLVVATPLLDDPNFRRAVVLILDHNEEGAFGVVLNRRTELPVGAVLGAWEYAVTGEPVLWNGGPVAADAALALAAARTPADPPLTYRAVGDALGNLVGLVDLDADPATLAPELDALRVFAGYSGWTEGQLEQEIAEGAWYVLRAEPGDPFSPDPELLWRQVLRRQGGDLALVATYPDDPALN